MKKKKKGWHSSNLKTSPEGKVIPHKFLPIPIFRFQTLAAFLTQTLTSGYPPRQGLRPYGGHWDWDEHY